MLILNKILPIVVLPLGLALLLLVTALVRKRWYLVVAAVALLYASSMPWVATHLSNWLEAEYPAIPIDQAEAADAIVMLGGVFGPPVAEGYVFNVGDTSERFEASIQLWQHKKARWLVFTGARLPWQTQQELEGNISARAAISRGIPAENIVVTPEVGNTADEAKAIAHLMTERGWRKVLLVTSAGHMPRAAILFRAASVNFAPFAVDYHDTPNHPLTLLDLLPNSGCLQASENTIREWYGSLFYRLFKGAH